MSSYKIKCRENSDDYYNSKVYDACHSIIDVSLDNLYAIDDINYFGDILYKYYTICPNCGYMVFIEEDILDDDIMRCARDKNSKEMYLYKKNVLRSELINLEYKEKNYCKKRIRK